MLRALSALVLIVAPITTAGPSLPTATSPTTAADSLHRVLARQDSLLFDALFAQCDAARANAFFTEDVEFYDDRSGLSVGDEVRENSRALAENCPAENGVRRILLEESVKVHPIEGYGAVQMGTHHFVERGAATSTVARFIHTWKQVGEDWKLARVISLHETVEAAQAAERRGK